MKANCLQCTIQNQARYATLRLLKEYEKINIHQFADGYVEENLALYDFEYEAENGIDGSNSSNSSDSGAKWTFIVVHRWQLSPAEVNQNLLEIEEIMAPVLPTPLPKKQRKYNMTEVCRKRLQENRRNQAASNSVGGFQRMVADIIQDGG